MVNYTASWEALYITSNRNVLSIWRIENKEQSPSLQLWRFIDTSKSSCCWSRQIWQHADCIQTTKLDWEISSKHLCGSVLSIKAAFCSVCHILFATGRHLLRSARCCVYLQSKNSCVCCFKCGFQIMMMKNRNSLIFWDLINLKTKLHRLQATHFNLKRILDNDKYHLSCSFHID